MGIHHLDCDYWDVTNFPGFLLFLEEINRETLQEQIDCQSEFYVVDVHVRPLRNEYDDHFQIG